MIQTRNAYLTVVTSGLRVEPDEEASTEFRPKHEEQLELELQRRFTERLQVETLSTGLP